MENVTIKLSAVAIAVSSKKKHENTIKTIKI